MDILHLTNDARERIRIEHDFLENHYEKRVIVVRRRPHLYIVEGDYHWFVTESEYYLWSRGRTYILDDELYHSGYRLEK